MMAKSPSINIDFKALQEKLRGQFSNLDPNDPSVWPSLPRNLLLLGVCAAIIAGLWFFWLKDVDAELLAAQSRETELRTAYRCEFDFLSKEAAPPPRLTP